ncbi:gluconate 2-dehydrogenase subunit 3 family protein [Parapedobacter sp. ISTM3]|uniref:Gluconate 2-dehydrogenase subunit 3 n=1 Tax=Parapedobacter luteus TaxID=623280 RepID=A0A1T4ZX28_9SPHI|nr:MULTISPECIES: gluconate 2-dehydrogenase subunit 3 family protein [Parapedobacter]MBK1438750.1 gluconate 2-dehydrogenase subunit 3 family protein [Parapedobacter sp. ISTM3]SKB27280.1 Gluconate 2-dehydrogenase subunit 3 [Parapedobacter luteus]
MNRRAAVRTLLYIAGGTMVLPACFRESRKASIALANLSISEADEGLLEELVETLVPATDNPGGKDLLLHFFVLKMVDDCHSPDDQQAFTKGLAAFRNWSQKELGKPFAEADLEQRTALLSKVADSGDDELTSFYGMVKRRTIQGYMNSQYVMTNLVKYELIPGRYNGYFPV